MKDKVILVDEQDKQIGTEFKLKAHQEGKLHRAFSIFVFNKEGELLLQQRALEKYHSGGLWTNTCCSHPRPDESIMDAAHRRLQEEMGFNCPLQEVFSFVYRASLDNNLIEHEFDHVLIGTFSGNPIINKTEAMDAGWKSFVEIKNDTQKNPEKYTYWFLQCYKKVFEKIKK